MLLVTFRRTSSILRTSIGYAGAPQVFQASMSTPSISDVIGAFSSSLGQCIRRILPTFHVIVTTCVLPSIAILVTSFRLFDRLRRSKFWWDDGWALASLVLTIIFMVAVLLHIKGTSKNFKLKYLAKASNGLLPQ